MRIKKFDVVEMNDNNRATILETNNNQYLAEIVNPYGITVDKRIITQDEIKQIIYKK